jgi:hypothetical protein
MTDDLPEVGASVATRGPDAKISGNSGSSELLVIFRPARATPAPLPPINFCMSPEGVSKISVLPVERSTRRLFEV